LVPLVAFGAAGTELPQPGNRTVREKELVAHVQDEKVMLEAAWAPVPAGAAGVRTAVTTLAGPISWYVGTGCPLVVTTWTRGTPCRAHGLLEVFRNTTAPASVDDVPPNLVKLMEAATADGEQVATAGVVVPGRLVVDEVEGVAEGAPPEQADSTPSDATASTEATPTARERGPGVVLMTASLPTAGESVRGPWPDTCTTRRRWPDRGGGAG
jgi:hypothetical protein